MKHSERRASLLHTPQLLYNILLRGRYHFVYDQMAVQLVKMDMAKRWNLAKSGLNLLHRRLVPWNMPLHMQIELTNYCNLRCPICATGSGALTRKAQAIDSALFRRLYAEVAPYLLTVSLWGWGEPLLHPQLPEILSTLQSYPVHTMLSTNGQKLADERIVEAIIATPPTQLIVAIDGLSDLTNSRFRQGAILEPALAGVTRLAALKKERGLRFPLLQLRYIVMQHNQHELPQLPEFARNHGFDMVALRTLSLIDTSHPDAIHGKYAPMADDYRAYAYQGGARVHRHDFLCLQPFWFPSVYSDGTVVACEQDYNGRRPMGFLVGSRSFREIWFGQEAAATRRILRDQAETLSFCRNCPFADRYITDSSVKIIPVNPEVRLPTVIEPRRKKVRR